MDKPGPVVAVHLGAGKHGFAKEPKYKSLARRASKVGLDLLQDGHTSIDVALAVGKLLEDSPLTNAGTGSNLNGDGQVECDACIMDSVTMTCTCVGAIADVKNPIHVAYHLQQDLKQRADVYGRAKPSVLTGEGAKRYAKAKNCCIVDGDKVLTTKETLSKYAYWKDVVGDDDDDVSDTIGVICHDGSSVAVAASSGGLAMKHPGRMGPAALPHCGVHLAKQNDGHIASCATGNGEDIIRTQFAHAACAELGKRRDESEAFQALYNSIVGSQLQSDAYMGVMSLSVDQDGSTVSYAHKTESMVVGYASAKCPPKAVLSRNNQRKVAIGAARI